MVSENEEPPAAEFDPPYATLGILVLITCIFVAMWVVGHHDITRAVAIRFGAKDNILIRQGQWWRLITPMFLHGGWPHLLVNGFSLYRLGGSMERIYGPRKYLIVLLIAGFTGNLLSCWLSPSLSLGASGALFGLVGAGLVFPIRYRSLIPAEARRSILRQLASVAIINLAIGFMLQGIIDNWAHIGGLVGGALAAVFLIPDVLESPHKSRAAGAMTTAVLAVLIGIVVVSWTLQWRWAKQNRVIPAVAEIAPPTNLSYTPAIGPAWWSITVPVRWRYVKGEWHAPDGAFLQVSEHLLIDPAIRPELQSLMSGKNTMNVELDGRKGWYSASPKTIRYRIPVYDRLFELTLESPQKPLSVQTTKELAAIANSVRFIRPPFLLPEDSTRR